MIYKVFPINSVNLPLIDTLAINVPSINTDSKSAVMFNVTEQNTKLGLFFSANQYYFCVWLSEEELSSFNSVGLSSVQTFNTPNEVLQVFNYIFKP